MTDNKKMPTERELRAALLEAHQDEAKDAWSRARTADGLTRIRLLEQALEHTIAAGGYLPPEVPMAVVVER